MPNETAVVLETAAVAPPPRTTSITVSFPGGVAVNAAVGKHTVRTDQPRGAGGGDGAPSPFDLFLASIATCMGFYALRFCQERGLPTEGLSLELDPRRDAEGKRVESVAVSLRLPDGFPERYRPAVLRAVDHCAVKRSLLEPPSFDLRVV